jgi:hypothetical protein
MLYARATCDSPPEKSCPYSENERAAEFSIRRADITLDDGVAPTITTAGGPLLSGSLIDRPSEFTVSASDRGSGVAAVQLLIDGRVTATYPVEESRDGCRQPYRVSVPCPSSTGTQSFTFRPTGIADGVHQLGLVAVDATGANRSAAVGPFPLRVSQRGVLNGRPSATVAVLTAGIRPGKHGRRPRRALTLSRYHRAEPVGTLTTEAASRPQMRV